MGRGLFVAAAMVAMGLFAAGLQAVPGPSAKAREASGLTRSVERRAEEVFQARYLAFVERGMSPGQPLLACEACVLQCAGASLADCRRACGTVCGLR